MLKGRTAFITGTNRGIGKALVAEFARNGADVIAHARRETPEFLSMLEEIASKYSVKVSPLFFDMTNSEAMKTAVRGLISSRIPVDILVNNAGVAHGGLFQMTGMSKVREVFDSNLFSMMELTQLLLRYMMRRRHASIINLGSVLGLDMPVGSCAYGLSKAAVMAFTRTLAAECGHLRNGRSDGIQGRRSHDSSVCHETACKTGRNSEDGGLSCFRGVFLCERSDHTHRRRQSLRGNRWIRRKCVKIS